VRQSETLAFTRTPDSPGGEAIDGAWWFNQRLP